MTLDLMYLLASNYPLRLVASVGSTVCAVDPFSFQNIAQYIRYLAVCPDELPL